jgi:hypothetical protein
MNIHDAKINSLKKALSAAQQEFDLTVMFHEAWKPMVFDRNLIDRMGVSLAHNTFHVIRMALRREVVLGLLRLWDTSKGALRLSMVANVLRHQTLIDALAADRASRMNLAGVEMAVRNDLQRKADLIIDIIERYARGGDRHDSLQSLRHLRDKRLAHRQVESDNDDGPADLDRSVESVYEDSSTIVQQLLSLVNGMAYDPQDLARVHQNCAKFFWAPARGEHTEGHPNYRPAPHDQG